MVKLAEEMEDQKVGFNYAIRTYNDMNFEYIGKYIKTVYMLIKVIPFCMHINNSFITL